MLKSDLIQTNKHSLSNLLGYKIHRIIKFSIIFLGTIQLKRHW